MTLNKRYVDETSNSILTAFLNLAQTGDTQMELAAYYCIPHLRAHTHRKL